MKYICRECGRKIHKHPTNKMEGWSKGSCQICGKIKKCFTIQKLPKPREIDEETREAEGLGDV